MANINKVFVAGQTYPLVDEISGYGQFSATQTMPSTTEGATQVAQIRYRTFDTTNLMFGATTTVNLYATGGSSSGNDWYASVDGTNLFLDPNGPPVLLGYMPDITRSTNSADVLDALAEAGLIRKTTLGRNRYSYSSLGPSLTLTRYAHSESQAIIEWVAQSFIINENTNITTDDLNNAASGQTLASTTYSSQPAVGSPVYLSTAMYATQYNPGDPID